MLIGHVCFRTITAHRQTAAGVAVATNPDGREFDSHMTKRWLIALFIAALFSGKTFADCVPSPDTPASVIEYFQKFNKPLPEQFCAILRGTLTRASAGRAIKARVRDDTGGHPQCPRHARPP